MTDIQILDALIEQAGGVKPFSVVMGVSRQSVWEWRTRITDSARIRMFLRADEIGLRLPKDFLKRALS